MAQGWGNEFDTDAAVDEFYQAPEPPKSRKAEPLVVTGEISFRADFNNPAATIVFAGGREIAVITGKTPEATERIKALIRKGFETEERETFARLTND